MEKPKYQVNTQSVLFIIGDPLLNDTTIYGGRPPKVKSVDFFFYVVSWFIPLK